MRLYAMGERAEAGPLVYNVEQDPREEVDIAISNLWILEPMMKQIYPFLFSVDKEGLILPGGDKPKSASVEIPFQRQDEIEQQQPETAAPARCL